MKYIALATAALLALPALAAGQETMGERAEDAGRSLRDAAASAGEKVEGVAKKVAAEAKELFTDEEARKVPVTLNEHKMDIPASVPAGKTRFAVKNEGSEKHNFEIEGEGIDEKFWIGLDPGQTKNLDVELASGEYTVYCPLDGHAEKGMKKTLTVQ